MTRPPRSLKPVVRYLVETDQGYSHDAWGLNPFSDEAWADGRWHHYTVGAAQVHADKVNGVVMKLTMDARITPVNRKK